MENTRTFYSNLAVGALVSVFALFASYKFTQISFEGKSYIGSVGTKYITLAEFKEKMGAVKKQQMQMGMDFKTEAGNKNYLEMRKQVMQDIVLTKFLLTQAENEKITFTDADTQQEIEKVKAQNFKNNEAEFQKALKKNNFTLEKLKEIIKERQTVRKLLEKIFADNVKITEADLKAVYDAKKNTDFTVKEQIEASHILVKEKAKAEELLAKIQAGEDFEKLAKENSMDPGSKNNGGKLGFFGKGQMVPPFEQAAWSLKVGEITKEPVQTQFGFHIIKKLGERPEHITPFNEVKNQIETQLKGEKQKEFYTKWRDKALRDADLKLNAGYEDFAIVEKPVITPDNKAPEKK